MAMAFRDSDLKALEEYHRQEEMDSDQVSDLQEEMEAMDSRLEMEAMDFRLANPVHLEDHQDLLDPCLLQPTALALSAFRGMK
jgi:plasmid maintenance system killer protein